MTRTGFRTETHGFPFPNWFPQGTPVRTFATPFGPWPVGNAAGGMCGGMVFAALDLFDRGVPPWPEPTAEVRDILGRRLLDSWDFPFGPARYFDLQRRPQQSRFLAGVRVVVGATAWTVETGWPAVKATLDAGRPCPLGLVQAGSWNPARMARHHQVLATGYADDAGVVTIPVYDPNHPNDFDTTLTLDTRSPDTGPPIRHSLEGETVRAFFATNYRPAAA